MKHFIKNKVLPLIVLFVLFFPITASAYEINGDFFSTVGGTMQNTGGTTIIPACDMRPYGSLTTEDMDALFNKAVTLQQTGTDFLNTLSLYSCDPGPCDDPRLTTLLSDPNENYESLGFVDDFRTDGIEAKLKEAIDYFAYLVKCNYEGDALARLGEAVRQLVTTYMVFADEFLIDALDFRFSAAVPNMDAYLDEQIEQLGKAMSYYQEGSDAFISTWIEPIGWSNQIIGELFGQDEWDAFSLLYQRLSTAVREHGVTERVRLHRTKEEIMQDLATQISALFVQSAAMSKTLGEQFSEYGGDHILIALNVLEKQLHNMKEGLNPLGYDDRYVPLNDFDDLYGLAQSLKDSCVTLESQVQQEQRDYDYIQDKITEQQNSLYTSYASQLADLTGCPLPDDPENQTQLDEFALCVECAGGDLYDCSDDLDPDAFEACVLLKDTAIGILGAKYRQIKDADLSLKHAQLRLENLGKQIENENTRMQYQIEIWNDYIGAQKEALDQYQDTLMGSYLVKKVKTKVKVKDKKTGKIIEKTKLKRTEKTFNLRDDQLDINLNKEKDLFEATRNFQIRMAQDDTVIMNLLLEQAEALIGIDMAVHNENAMIAAFDTAMRQKENLLRLWQQNREFYDKYYTQKLPAHRIIQSQKILELADRFNELAHYCHLATKALEYKFMEVLQGILLPGGDTLNATDLFKCQTTGDFDAYLHNLQEYKTLECPGGVFQQHDYRISVVYDALGLTDDNLGDLDHDGFVDADGQPVEELRFEKFQQFVNEHIDQNGDLSFTFTNSVYDRVFIAYQKANLKIWQGPIPCAPTLTSDGLTASLFFRGSPGSVFPVVYLAQKGTHTLLRKTREVADYYPVKVRALINANDPAPEPFTKDFFTPFVDIDPRFHTAPMGEWTPAFTNRSVVSSEWGVTVHREPAEFGFDRIPFHKLRDICLYLGTIGNNFD